jgi:hypothetical protein
MNRRTSIRLRLLLLGLVGLSLAAFAGSETNLGITVEPPSTGGGADIVSTDIADLDLIVSPDSPLASSVVTLLVHVDQAVTSISISAEISNKSSLKIKWYNLLENGHLLIGDSSGGPATKGNGWQFGTVWQSTSTGVAAGDYSVEIPIVLDLSAGGSVNPRDIPAGSTNGKATIVWTIVVGTL